jgi:hypothetical protein
VLLVRGEETILVAPNSVIGLPLEKKDRQSTTIVQQAGSVSPASGRSARRHLPHRSPIRISSARGGSSLPGWD